MKESTYHNDQQDCILKITGNSEFDIRRQGGDPDVGATSPTFSNGTISFDGSTSYISYPSYKVKLSEPERAFSIRTKVYLTNVDASVFVQRYDTDPTPDQLEFRFLICGLFPNVGNVDKLSFEVWDQNGTGGVGVPEMRGRVYNTSLVATALNTWKEFVATYDGRGGATPEAGICLYMDGVRVDDADSVDDNGGDYQAMEFNPDLSLEIGKNLEGKMEFLEIWNRVLTPDEIYNMYN